MKLIDKDKVVAQIKKKIEINLKRNEESVDNHDDYGAYYWGGVIAGLNVALMICDTLEAKEVDVNKEISQFIADNFKEAKIGHKLTLRRTAKHFFDLGVKAQMGE